ncbi:MAG TPA: magnesium transporter [Turneriella sp.]|nr:magnesium transporter [Turneriella sp.]HNA78519.1 magnesium transporter [Turneriella sp.]HNE18142.1 magnesium transporter [Turneriella sp.]HNL53209.1 magnesium transporter [Turneriella sp.]HNN00071.1 magnesium transporter [Turneriella sp.]
MNTAEKKFHLLTKENYPKIVNLLRRLCKNRRFLLLKRALHTLHPTSLALLWDSFDESEREIILTQLSSEYAAEFLTELGSDERTAIFRSKDTAWIFDRLEELETDDIAGILRELDARDTNFILRRFDKNYTGKIKEILKYPEGSAGAMMTSDFLAVSRQATVKSIISQFQKLVKQNTAALKKAKGAAATHTKLDDLQFTFVVDRDNKFLGYIPLRKLILEKSTRKAHEIMQPAQVMVHPEQDRESVGKIFKDYNLLSLPVVDSRGILLGHITVDDVVDVLEEEATEDILRLGGVTQDTQDAPHTHSIGRMARGRLPWLAINLVTQVLSAWIITFFDQTISKVILLAPLMTVIGGQGGNATMQSVTVVVRSLALGQINSQNIWKVVLKEIGVCSLNGLFIGTLAASMVLAYSQKPALAACMFIGLICNMFVAGAVGTLLPLGLRAVRVDPALASGPIATTFTDICGFSVFLGVATFLISQYGGL